MTPMGSQCAKLTTKVTDRSPFCGQEYERPALDSPEYQCVRSVIRQLDSGVRSCNCSVACREIDYAIKYSESVWPSDNFEPFAKVKYGDLDELEKPEPAENEDGWRFEDNLLKVNVYFASLNVQKVTETPVYESVTGRIEEPQEPYSEQIVLDI